MKSDGKNFQTLSIQDSEYQIGFSKFFCEDGKPDLPFHTANISNFCIFSAFLNFQGPLAKIVRKLGFQKKSGTNDSQNEYFKAKRNSLKENLQQPTQPTQN